MNIAESLEYLAGTKVAIRNAIMAKGVDVPSNTPFRTYAELIMLIEGGEPIEHEFTADSTAYTADSTLLTADAA